MRHNKKRNAAIIYEQLVRFISKSLIDGNVDQAREAMAIVREHFAPGTHLHREFKLFNALVRTTVNTESIALRILDEAKKAAKQHDFAALDREKGILIKSINKRLNQPMFFEQRVPDYRSFATVQTLLNDWRMGMNADIARIVEYEQKVSKMLCEQKQVESLEKSGRISKLSVDIMKKKVCEKVSQELTTEQFKMVKMSLVGDKTNLVPLLEKTKRDAFETIGEFSHKNNNGILKEKLNEVKMQIENLSSSDITEENVSKFLLLNKMIEEMTGADDGGR